MCKKILYPQLLLTLFLTFTHFSPFLTLPLPPQCQSSPSSSCSVSLRQVTPLPLNLSVHLSLSLSLHQGDSGVTAVDRLRRVALAALPQISVTVTREAATVAREAAVPS